MKPIIAAFLFLVSWQEYQLKHTYFYMSEGEKIFTNSAWESVQHGTECGVEYYTVETVDRSIRLKSQDDVDKFVGYDGPCRSNPVLPSGIRTIQMAGTQSWCSQKGIIGPGAFKIKVEEIK